MTPAAAKHSVTATPGDMYQRLHVARKRHPAPGVTAVKDPKRNCL